MGARTTLRWIALALAGLVIAAGASVAASRLAGQRIGLASEPITAGEELAPRQDRPAATRPRRHAEDHPSTTPQRTVRTAPAPTVVAPSSGDDEGGGGEPDGDD